MTGLRLLPLLTLLSTGATAAAPDVPAAEQLIGRGTAHYYRGDALKALASYQEAVKRSSHSVEAWLCGARLLDELGEPRKALRWYQGAASAPAAGAEAHEALGWAQLRLGEPAPAERSFQNALAFQKDHAHSLQGLARALLKLDRPKEALDVLDRVAPDAPFPSLTWSLRGQAQERLGRSAALDAYRQAVISDSFNAGAREALGRAQMNARNFDEAFRHFSKMLDSDPRNPRLKTLLQRIKPLVTRPASELLRPALRALESPLPASADGSGAVPRLKIGLGTDPMGRPRLRTFVTFKVHPGFWIIDPRSQRRLASGPGGQDWQARLVVSSSGKGKARRRRALVEITDDSGAVRLKHAGSVVIRPQSPEASAVVLDDPARRKASGSPGLNGRTVRGELEITPDSGRRTLKLVNLVDLESYTHGVLSAEMPIRSPLEALKAQAVVARSHALYIMKVTRRHRRDGYDLCDEQHCQVYGGGRAESDRSRAVVAATRGRIVTYRGQVAHVIYSSNCGGRSQSGKDMPGWGDVPYWRGIQDAAEPTATPLSPARLHGQLSALPAAYCRPSSYVHASHFRWSLLIPFAEAAEKIRRRHGVAGLKSLKVARRSPSGHVTRLLIAGAKKRASLSSEMAIRGLLGPGTLRSTLFALDTEYGPGLKPEALVFQGGGWGHAVGLCQSGAMGRAEAGQTYEEIVKAYFPGTELGQLKY